jgi:membrane protein implicated in regulation of membrane protease activity
MELQFWHWFVLGLGLVIAEMIAPGIFLLWIGIAAGVTGLVTLLIPTMSWQVQFIIFAGLAVACVFAARAYLRKHPIVSADNTLNRRGSQYVGRVFNLHDPIINGRGTVRVDDTIWRADGPDLPAGSKVKVTGIAGTALKVEAAEG